VAYALSGSSTPCGIQESMGEPELVVVEAARSHGELDPSYAGGDERAVEAPALGHEAGHLHDRYRRSGEMACRYG
jgi:hypothetical protein